MDIPFIFPKLEDPRVIPLLIEIIEKAIEYQNNDLDSSDKQMFSSIQISRLIKQSCLALSSFYRRMEFF
jgi:hypothetical protein